MKLSLVCLLTLTTLSSFAHADGGSAARFQFSKAMSFEQCEAKISQVARRYDLTVVDDNNDIEHYGIQVALLGADHEGQGSGYFRDGVCYVLVQ
ncbi:MAG: hypothetical protein ACXVB9_01765 [Bdellovibrionota bacterium]